MAPHTHQTRAPRTGPRGKPTSQSTRPADGSTRPANGSRSAGGRKDTSAVSDRRPAATGGWQGKPATGGRAASATGGWKGKSTGSAQAPKRAGGWKDRSADSGGGGGRRFSSDSRKPRRDHEPRAPRVPALTGPNAFVDLGVPSAIAAVLASQGITEPTPIQALTIPAALSGGDVLGRGRTGSGKTLSFGLPMLTILAGPRPARRQPRGLVLAPTRELAMQVVDALAPLAATLGMRAQLVIGGSSYDRQIRGLERADIIVATPGRLVDLAERGSADLSAIRIVVLDEADHMADLGFMPEIEAIMGRVPDDAQGLLFSATLDHDVDRLVRRYLHDPTVHNADPASATVATMAHHVVLVHPKDKDAVTVDIALRRGRTVAFVRTQLGADRLAGQLEAQGVRTAALHGGMKQGMRTRTLDSFRQGRIDVLVATDVAARGLHVDDIDLVLHVDPPHGPKEYLHRSGRTARAGASGTVISLATLRQQRSVAALTSRAGVNPAVLRARPGDAALLDLIS